MKKYLTEKDIIELVKYVFSKYQGVKAWNRELTPREIAIIYILEK
jgi:hypothetical protein